MEDILEKMTAQDPNLRFQDVDTILQVLSQYRKVNFIKKITLMLKSWNRIRYYSIVARQNQEKRLEIVKKIQDEDFDKTIFY